MRVFMTGATGFIGRALTSALLARGNAVLALSRSGTGPTGAEVVRGDPTTSGPWRERVAECDAIVHLAGEPIAGKRWSEERKRLIKTTRVDGGAQLVAAIAAAAKKPRVLVTASGADYYPFDDSDRAYTEADPAGPTFLSDVCRAWEASVAPAREHGVRVAALRIGIVLGKGEGAMARLAPLFKLFFGGPIGSGRQWVSWIHVDDVVGAFLHALDGATEGAVNAVAGSVRQADFARTIGDVVKRPSWLPAPALAMKVALGELGEYLLHGRKVVPAVLDREAYGWRRKELAGAVAASV